MIRAKIIPPSARPEIAVDILHAALHRAHSQAKERVAMTRRKCAKHHQLTHRRGYAEGYRSGLLAAAQEMRSAIEGITSTYRDAVELAKVDITSLARALAARIIERNLSEDPEIFQSWIHSAMTFLGSSRTVALVYHPRYAPILERLSVQLPPHVTLSASQELGDADFMLSGDNGSIEWCWRKALEDA
jgi:flagellar biosynthesis/type III secretory pathway protein FliH